MQKNPQELWPLIAPHYAQLVEKQLPMAMLGWAYAAHIDRDFLFNTSEIETDQLCTNFPEKGSSGAPSLTQTKRHSKKGNASLLNSLLKEPNITARWKKLKKAIDANDDSLSLDSFGQLSRNQTMTAIQSYFAPKKKKQSLNFVILGAGPVGLAMANALKLRLKNKVRILIIDHRSERVHTKKPYSRNWVTHLFSQTFSGILPESGQALIKDFGIPPYAGCTVNTLESILHLSCQDADVKFLFDQQYSLDFIPQSDIDLVVDATGGRWEPSSMPTFKPLELSLPVPNLDGLEGSVAEYGVPSMQQIQPRAVTLNTRDEPRRWLYPAPQRAAQESVQESTQEGAIKETQQPAIYTRLMKIRNIDFARRSELLKAVNTLNCERHFYLWPGHLKDEINELLLLVNLNANDSKVLSQHVRHPIAVEDIVKNTAMLNDLSTPIAKILPTLEGAMVEPPFSYTPRFCHPDAITVSAHARPVVRIGDSLYNGHPKAGNGLSSHLNFVSVFSEVITRAATQLI